MDKIKQYIKENTEVIEFAEHPDQKVIDLYNIKGLLKIAKFYHTGLKDLLGQEIYNGDELIVCNGSINSIKWKDKPYKIKYTLNNGFNMPFFCWNKKGKSLMNSTHYCLKKTDKKFYYIELTEFGVIPNTFFYSKKGVCSFQKAYFTNDKKKLRLIANKIKDYRTEICKL